MKMTNLIIPKMYYQPKTKAENQILAKMREHKISSFSKPELNRVFSGCAGPGICIKTTKRMINQGLTIDSVYNGPKTLK